MRAMNKLELRILAERLYEAVTGRQPDTARPEHDKRLRKIEEILEEEMANV